MIVSTCQGRDCCNVLRPRELRPAGPGHNRPLLWCSERCRKTKYSASCLDCGAPLNGSDGRGPNAPARCFACARVYDGARRKVWTRERIIAAIQEWATVYGEPPASPDWNPYHARVEFGDLERAARFEDANGRWPSSQTVIDEFGSWNAGIAAAGFAPRPPGGGGGNELRSRRARAVV